MLTVMGKERKIDEDVTGHEPDPTPEMITAGVLAYLSYDGRFEDYEDVVLRIWQAMHRVRKPVVGQFEILNVSSSNDSSSSTGLAPCGEPPRATSQEEFLYEILDGETIPDSAFTYYRARLLNRVHSLLLRAYQRRNIENGLKQKDFASRCHRSKEVINRHLAMPTNSTLTTTSDLFLGLRAELVVDLLFLEDSRGDNNSSDLHVSTVLTPTKGLPSTKFCACRRSSA